MLKKATHSTMMDAAPKRWVRRNSLDIEVCHIERTVVLEGIDPELWGSVKAAVLRFHRQSLTDTPSTHFKR